MGGGVVREPMSHARGIKGKGSREEDVGTERERGCVCACVRLKYPHFVTWRVRSNLVLLVSGGLVVRALPEGK